MRVTAAFDPGCVKTPPLLWFLLVNSAGALMKGFVAGAERGQASLLPECLEDWVDESNPVRVIDAFVDALDLADLGFDGVEPEATGGRPTIPQLT